MPIEREDRPCNQDFQTTGLGSEAGKQKTQGQELQTRLKDFDYQLNGYAVDHRLAGIAAGYIQGGKTPLDTLSLGLAAKNTPKDGIIVPQSRIILLAHGGGLGALNTRGADGLAQAVTFHEHRVSHLNLADAFVDHPQQFAEQNAYITEQFPLGGLITQARHQNIALSPKVSIYFADVPALEIDLGPYAFLGFVVVYRDGKQLVVPSPAATLDTQGFENIDKINFATLTGKWA